jgi:hypothetical protein
VGGVTLGEENPARERWPGHDQQEQRGDGDFPLRSISARSVRSITESSEASSSSNAVVRGEKGVVT